MSDEKEGRTGNRPTGFAWMISEGRWTKIGAAWLNRDGSLNVKLDAFPANGRLHIRAPSSREDAEGEEPPPLPTA